MPLLQGSLFAALLMVFFYAIPALSVHLMVWGLADPRRESWRVTPGAHAWKERYRKGAFFGQYLNLFLLGLFLVQTVAAFTLERSDCRVQASHLSAAAWNLVVAVERVWLVGYLVLVAGAVAGIVWAVSYYAKARRMDWADPRRRDGLFVHILIVPLALVLLFVAFGSILQTFCPALSP